MMCDVEPLWRSYDAVGFDLDGVMYRGTAVVAAAPSVIGALRHVGVKVAFVTNNAQRTPSGVCDYLKGFDVDASPVDVVTSAQATARLMATALPKDAAVMCIGSTALAAEISASGLRAVPPGPTPVEAVCVGFDPALTWADLNEGCYAVQAGAAYYACNDDESRPTERGIAIGMGGVLAAMATALRGTRPITGGKPERPLLDEARRRLDAARPIFVGDRLDTDIAGARRAGWVSLMVLSGVHGPADVVAAAASDRPDYLAYDVGGLLEPARVAVQQGERWCCGDAAAWAAPDLILTFDGPCETTSQCLDALWAVANAAWTLADKGCIVDARAALDRIGLEQH